MDGGWNGVWHVALSFKIWNKLLLKLIMDIKGGMAVPKNRKIHRYRKWICVRSMATFFFVHTSQMSSFLCCKSVRTLSI